nr:hypothetical protein [Ningiella sp. W23]
MRNAQQSERIYIPQHGSGNPKELSIESDQDTNGLCQVNAPQRMGVEVILILDTIVTL